MSGMLPAVQGSAPPTLPEAEGRATILTRFFLYDAYTQSSDYLEKIIHEIAI